MRSKSEFSYKFQINTINMKLILNLDIAKVVPVASDPIKKYVMT